MSNKSTQFKPGQSGNPKGAPKRNWTWSGELQKAVEKKDEKGIPIKQALAQSLVNEGLKGNVQAFNAMANRMDGMPQQDITTDGEKIEGVVIYKPEKNEE